MKNILLDTLLVINGTGQGYARLPLCVEFKKKYRIAGFDSGENRIHELSTDKDHKSLLNIKVSVPEIL